MSGATGVEFVRLPHREMNWAPVPIRHGAGIAAWRPGWVCPGCAEEVRLDSLSIPDEAGSPCGSCGAELRWVFDRAVGRASWSCTDGCAQPAAITSARAAAPTVRARTLTEANAPPPRLPVWSECGPPRDCSALATNSWLYVPLLHAAAGEMGPEALMRWRTDPRAAWWEDARHTLATSCPVPVATLTEALLTATNAASERLPEHLLREAAALPTGASVHIGWVVCHLAQHHDGYISAPCQEACLELFGGRAFAAELDRASDAFRQAPPPERRTPAGAPPVAAHPNRCQPPGRPPSPDSHPEHTPPPAEPRNVPPPPVRRSNLNQPIENREMTTTCWPQRRATHARLPHPVAPDVAAGDADAGAAPRRPLPHAVIRRLPLLARPRPEFRTSHPPARVPTRSASVPMPPPKPACASGLHPSMP